MTLARCIAILLLTSGAPLAAQIGLPDARQTIGSVVAPVTDTLDRLGLPETLETGRSITDLARDRVGRLRDIIRRHRDTVEPDDQGEPARRGIVLLLDADEPALTAARALGFTARSTENFGNLGLSVTELTTPDGMTLTQALKTLHQALPGKTITADQFHFASGKASANASSGPAPAAVIKTPVGMIDGGVASAVPVRAARGFADGAPAASDHGTAVASLLRHAGVRSIVSADVYGRDPVGGSALAITRALDWLQAQNISVVSISLTGPNNGLLSRAVATCLRRGMVIVAAVGNDGPAAPPAFPASYPGVLAVTGVDGRNRALIEAGRPLHLDYAAPGADMKALDARGRWRAVRGTSFAVPLVAARAAGMKDMGREGDAVRTALDREARDLGRKGPDDSYGRGLLCEACRPR